MPEPQTEHTNRSPRELRQPAKADQPAEQSQQLDLIAASISAPREGLALNEATKGADAPTDGSERAMKSVFDFMDAGVWVMRSIIGAGVGTFMGLAAYVSAGSGNYGFASLFGGIAVGCAWFTFSAGKFAWQAGRGRGSGII